MCVFEITLFPGELENELREKTVGKDLGKIVGK